MDTLSLTKETNVMSQADLDKLQEKYSFPPRIQLRIPGEGETVLSVRQGEVAFYEAAFLAGLRLPIHPTIRKILNHYKICLAQLFPNAWRSVIYSLAPEKNLLWGSPSNMKGWKKSFFFRFRGRVGVLSEHACWRWDSMGKSCNKLPALTKVEAKRMEEVLCKVDPGGYFDVLKVLGSRNFNKHFAVGCMEISSSGGDNITSSDEGEFRGSSREDSVEYLGAIRGDIGRIARRAFPDIPDKTLLRVVIQEKRPREGIHAAEKGGLDSSKGKEAMPPPPPKRFKSNKRAINTTLRTSTAGTSSPGDDLGSGASMMSDALVMARADSAELELVKAQNRALKAENRLAEMSEQGAKSAIDIGKPDVVANLEAEVAELTSKLTKAKELAIEEFKSSEDFKVAVTDSVATYFSEGFEFYKRQLLHQFPHLGIDVANMEMDPGFAEKEEEATKEGKEGVGIGGLA
ncbi:hypothetical protein Acr_02g0014600 [Actinidia rufa]|uniref:Transposase (putative) gypsy type domain-containing protein n=1 Tax=Actinidia rufa TaxID=165716 RepID=A0A7J0E9Z7_9ERIC|nr:hypothetical protein Acr_02g0014600 [Actinidia rufa]